MSKYKAKRQVIDGISFASGKEATRYLELKIQEKMRVIADLKLQPRFLLQAPFRDIQGKLHRGIEYVGDFDYVDQINGGHVVEEVKGFKTPIYRLKVKLLLAKYRDIRFVEVK